MVIDVQSLRAVWSSTLRINCPHCGKVHEISARETYINGVLHDAAIDHPLRPTISLRAF
jgi:hypothetical protein